MTRIAILGYGVVGSGVFKVLGENRAAIERIAGRPLSVKRVLDVRDFPGDAARPCLTADYDDIVNDPDIAIVAEAMGGLSPAYDYVKRALLAGKHVCTSNKELVAAHGAELIAIAREKGLNFLFEASVGGGIPLIRPLSQTLATDEIRRVTGIVNGTTNYILTEMSLHNIDFRDALQKAQEKGYAEKDPSADVEGHDAARKLAILLSLVTGHQVNYQDIHTEGISRVTPEDIAFAKHFGFTLKLLADGRAAPGGVEAWVAPMLVHAKHPFDRVIDAYNAVLVETRMTGNVMFIGRGAGKEPTAAAMVTDIADIARHLTRHIPHLWSPEKTAVLPVAAYRAQKMIRVRVGDKAKALAAVEERDSFTIRGQVAWLTGPETEAETRAALTRLAESGGCAEPPHVLRVYDAEKI